MEFFEKLGLYESRNAYLQHLQQRRTEEELTEVRDYLLSTACEEDIKRLQKGEYILGLPTRFFAKTSKKVREVHVFSGKDKYLLSLIRFHLHDYNVRLSKCLYSGVLGRSQLHVFRKICTTPGIHRMYCFKTDVRGYSKSLDGDILKGILYKILGSDKPLYDFLCHYLDERRCYENGEIFLRETAVVEGSPLSGFFENVYLSEFDFVMEQAADVYCRYNDDIIVYTSSKEKLMDCRQLVEQQFAQLKLTEKVEKLVFADPGEYVDFLGIGVAGAKRKMLNLSAGLSMVKILADRMVKVRKKYHFSSDLTMLLMIQRLDAQFAMVYRELPYLTETEELRILDHAVQDALRRVGSMHRGKRRYSIRYETLNQLGYKSLICRFYEARKAGCR